MTKLQFYVPNVWQIIINDGTAIKSISIKFAFHGLWNENENEAFFCSLFHFCIIRAYTNNNHKNCSALWCVHLHILARVNVIRWNEQNISALSIYSSTKQKSDKRGCRKKKKRKKWKYMIIYTKNVFMLHKVYCQL